MINKFLKTQDLGYLLGDISDNVFHQHYAVQVVIALNKTVIIHSKTSITHCKSQLIQSMQSHRLDCNNQQVLVLLINPISKLGHMLNKHSDSQVIKHSQKHWIVTIRELAINWQQNTLTDLEFKNALEISSDEFTQENKQCFHKSDKRILTALDLLRKNVKKIIPLETIASQVFLSPSRFIHLFKTETGITYRRMQLWNKLMASIDDITQYKNITDLAHAHGFSDSAHYNRTFKQTFGLNPKTLIKYSQFVQF